MLTCIREARRWVGIAAGLLMAIAVVMGPAQARALPSGFSDTLVVSKVTGPSDIAWLPDGRMLIGGKLGQVSVWNGTTRSVALDLGGDVCVQRERGLQGIAVHPNFADNGWVYVYYAFDKENHCNSATDAVTTNNRLSRFKMTGNTIARSSETVLFESPSLQEAIHNGGFVGFGKDGLLYVTTGDASTADANLTETGKSLLGKVLRLTDTGGIPSGGNMFTGPDSERCAIGGSASAGKVCQEIWAMGLRNPFRAAFDPNASGVKLYINDVGQEHWEEVDQGAMGANYGWPTREGPCPLGIIAGPLCTAAAPKYTDPIHFYAHRDAEGGAATAAVFVPNSSNWPAAYRGTYLFAEYAWGKVFRLVPKSGGFDQVEFHGSVLVTMMAFGPDGQLYYATRSSQGQIRKISFAGLGSNRPPAAAAEASPTSGPSPLEVDFDAGGSSDPDGDSLSYAWAFGDGTSGSGATPSHTYAQGTFTAVVTVTDGHGGSDTASVRIDSGNRPPAPVIDAPAAGATFAVGDLFTLTGHATDPEDGPLADTRLTWEVLLHHNTHTHPFIEPRSGNGIVFTAPSPEDLDAARTSYLEIRLTATDDEGLSTTVTRNFDPRKVALTLATSPSGLRINAGNVVVAAAPQTVQSWEKFVFPVEAPNQTRSGTAYAFGAWSDGGAQTHDITTPTSPATYTASFSADGGEEGEPFTPVADTYVSKAAPSANYGTATSLRTDAEPEIRSYLRFNLTGLGTVQKAVLRVWSSSSHSKGYEVHGVASTSWSETGITFGAGAPAFAAGAAGASGPLQPSTWSEVDVTSLVSGNGLVSFALTPLSTTAMTLSSREAGARAPQLVITGGGGGGGGGDPTDTPLAPVADSYVKQDAASTNYGKSLSLRTDAQPVLNSYLRFDLGGMGPSVTGLKLRLFVNSANAAGFRVHRLDDDAWGESIITFANAPTPLAVVGTSGPVSAGAFKEVVLSGVPTADQFPSLVISSASTTATSFASREAGANAPQLIVTTGG